MSVAEQAWIDWYSHESWQDLSDIRKAAFLAGFRAGAKAQWDASVADEFAARRTAPDPRESKG